MPESARASSLGVSLDVMFNLPPPPKKNQTLFRQISATKQGAVLRELSGGLPLSYL